MGEGRSWHLFWAAGSAGAGPPVGDLPPGRTACWHASTSRGPKARLFCEFDGRIKYTGLRRPNETIEEAVLREKRREEAILELTGWRIIRLTWEDLAQSRGHRGPDPPARWRGRHSEPSPVRRPTSHIDVRELMLVS